MPFDTGTTSPNARLVCQRLTMADLIDCVNADSELPDTSSAALFDAVCTKHLHTKKIGVEPVEAPVAYLKKYGPKKFGDTFGHTATFSKHNLLGTGGWGVCFPHLDVSAIDDIVPLEEGQWRFQQRKFADRGVDIGHSTAACQTVIGKLSEDMADVPANFFSIVYDRSEFYK